MGNISSVYEGCFGEEATKPPGQQTTQINPKSPEEKPKKPKTEGNDCSTEAPSSKKPSAESENKVTIKDFHLIKVIGRGSFGKVFLVQKKSNQKFYALKTLKKADILDKNYIESAITEKRILQISRHPFVVRLRYSFQSETTLYLIMDFCSGGELFTQLRKKGNFNEQMTRFYAAEVLLALEYLHDKLNIIYRDLKPENILLDSRGHVKLTDFGLSKENKKTNSFCGTPEYLAPEILLGQGHDSAVDWWSFGCLIYELLAGVPPFSSRNRSQLFHDILKTNPVMPAHFSEQAKDLLSKLLVRNPAKRLGCNGSEEIKKHPFFQSVKWDDILMLKERPPIVPTNTLHNFARVYLNEPVQETPSENGKYLNDPRNEIKSYYFAQDEIAESHRVGLDFGICQLKTAKKDE